MKIIYLLLAISAITYSLILSDQKVNPNDSDSEPDSGAVWVGGENNQE